MRFQNVMLFVLLSLSLPALCGDDDFGKLTLTCFETHDIGRGNGLAILLQTPEGKNYLYDTGIGHPEKLGGWVANFNTGRDVIAPFLKEKKIDALDGVMISHAHYDHFGGLVWLMDNMPIKKLYDSGFLMESEDSEVNHYTRIREKFKEEGKYQLGLAGTKLELDKKLDVLVFAPPKEYFQKIEDPARPKNDTPIHYLVNANSLMLRVTHGKNVFLFPGDIQDIDQRASLLKQVPHEQLKCNVLFAPGHGIHAVPEFAQAAKPAIVICSALPRYAKVSPSPKLYEKVGAKTYLTGIHGRITIVSDGKMYEVSAEPKEQKEHHKAP